jgi:hypothetical protein
VIQPTLHCAPGPIHKLRLGSLSIKSSGRKGLKKKVIHRPNGRHESMMMMMMMAN